MHCWHVSHRTGHRLLFLVTNLQLPLGIWILLGQPIRQSPCTSNKQHQTTQYNTKLTTTMIKVTPKQHWAKWSHFSNWGGVWSKAPGDFWLPYLFANKPIPAISRDPKLVTQNTNPMLTKKFRKLSAISRDPKIEQSTRIKHKKYCANFLGNLQIQVEVNNKHDRSANL